MLHYVIGCRSSAQPKWKGEKHIRKRFKYVDGHNICKPVCVWQVVDHKQYVWSAIRVAAENRESTQKVTSLGFCASTRDGIYV